ncbi:hypothetical protein BSLG_006024 [Batrachochytrium salamandrivorans]|nr:hypothetical protein BSLG_006024 [Batrachochytrium salamandrivorans]
MLRLQSLPDITKPLDLAATARGVSTEEARAYATEGGLCSFEASAKTGEFVMDILQILLKIPLETLAAARGRTGN